MKPGTGRQITYDRSARNSNVEAVTLSIIGAIQRGRCLITLAARCEAALGMIVLQRFQLPSGPTANIRRNVDRWPDSQAKATKLDITAGNRSDGLGLRLLNSRTRRIFFLRFDERWIFDA